MNSVFSLEELFRGKVFAVPDYQRGYSWDQRQWDDFLEDLEYLGEEKHHYTGTVVLHQQKGNVRDEGGQNHSVFHVVDGQQRLTTVVVLLECVRVQINRFNTTLADGIRKSYIEFRDLNQQPYYKLRLNADCQDYFVGNVLTESSGPSGPSIASHRRLKEAKAHFETYLLKKQITEGERFADWLLGFYMKIVAQLRVSQYVVEQQSEVGIIFEVMNNRGKHLSDLEKTKNYLLYIGSKLELEEDHDLSDSVNATWATIFQRLMASGLSSSAEEDRLLRAHWLMVYEPNAREWAGSTSIKEKFSLKLYKDKHKSLLEGLAHYTNSLKSVVVPFCEAFRPTHTDAFTALDDSARAEVRRAAEKLHRLGVLSPFLQFCSRVVSSLLLIMPSISSC